MRRILWPKRRAIYILVNLNRFLPISRTFYTQNIPIMKKKKERHSSKDPHMQKDILEITERENVQSMPQIRQKKFKMVLKLWPNVKKGFNVSII